MNDLSRFVNLWLDAKQALYHQRYRNHEFSLGCAGCAEAERLLTENQIAETYITPTTSGATK